nr:hypothetical protein [Candidatus Sigynarchaeum springense]
MDAGFLLIDHPSFLGKCSRLAKLEDMVKMKNPGPIQEHMDEMQKTGVAILGLLVSGVISLGTGIAFFKSAWWLIAVGIACFIGMMEIVYMSVKPKREDGEEILYRRGEPRQGE